MQISRIVYRDQDGNLLPLPAWLRAKPKPKAWYCPRCGGRLFQELDERGNPETVCVSCGERPKG